MMGFFTKESLKREAFSKDRSAADLFLTLSFTWNQALDDLLISVIILAIAGETEDQ